MATLNVPGTYPTITAALADALSGDTILVAAGAGYAGNEAVTVTVNNLTFSAPASVSGIVLTPASGILKITLADASPIQIVGNVGNNSFVGNNGANIITDGGGGNDAISSGGGDDTITVTGGTDTVNGGAGNDLLIVDYSTATGSVQANGSSQVSDGGTRTVTFQQIERLQVIGGSGADSLQGNSGNDTLDGGAGNDTIIASGGTDTLKGGAGNDVFQINAGFGGTGTVDGGGDTDTVQSFDLGTYSFTNVEVLDTNFVYGTTKQFSSFGAITDTSGSANSQISIYLRGAGGVLDLSTRVAGAHSVSVTDSGLTAAITLTGSVNGDTLNGSAFNDTIDGGAGDDTIYTSAGTDTLKGGAGNDLFQVSGYTGTGTVDGGADTDTVQATDLGTYSFTNVEILDAGNVYGSLAQFSSFSTITSNSGAPDSQIYLYLRGGAGTLDLSTRVAGAHSVYAYDNGLTAGITLTGSVNGDYLSGSAFKDTIDGGAGNDTIVTTDGGDTLRGGAGNDLFQLYNGNAGGSIDGGADTDTVQSNELGTYSFTNVEVLNTGIVFGSLAQFGSFSTITSSSGAPDSQIYLYLRGDTGTLNLSTRVAGAHGVVTYDNGLTAGITLTGSVNGDTLNGSTYDDTLDGGAGNDILNGSTGTDTLRGGAGNDLFQFYYYNYTGGGTVDGGADTDTVQGSYLGDYSFSNVEILDTTYAVATLGQLASFGSITGSGGAPNTQISLYLRGAGGTLDLTNRIGGTQYVTVSDSGLTAGITLTGSVNGDTLTGSAYADTIDGGAGNDTITNSTGVDTLRGGAGNDLFQIYDYSAIGGTVDGGADTDTVKSNDLGAFSLTNVEVLDGNYTYGTVAQFSSFGTITDTAGSADSQINLYLRGTGGVLDLSSRVSGAHSVYVYSPQNNVTSSLTLTGTANADTLNGSTYDDTIDGGAGNDTILSSGGTDTLRGGSGNDLFRVDGSSGAGTVDGGADTDTVKASDLGAFSFTNVEVLDSSYTYGTTAQFSSFGTITDTNGTADSQIQLILRGAGGTLDLSTRITGAHTAYVYAQNGDLTAGVTVTGTANNDTLYGSAYDDTLNGGNGNDILDGYGGSDTLDGGAGNDTISAGNYYSGNNGPGTDTLRGGTGNDTFNIQGYYGGSGTVDGGADTDTVKSSDLGSFSFTNVEVLDSPNVSGTIAQFSSFGTITDTGGAANSQIYLYLRGDGGTLDLTGRVAGNHSVYVSDGGLTAGVKVIGSATNDQIYGSAYDDYLDGGAGNDTLNGYGGLDTLHGGAGNDTLSGNNDGDTATYFDAAAGVTVNLGVTSAQNTVSAGTDTLQGLSNLIGSGFGDTLTGDANDNRLDGGAGNDTLSGGNGNDTLIGGLGDDKLTGGAGTDTASYAGAASAVTVNLATTTAQDTKGAGTDTLATIENLTGSSFGDTLMGDGFANRLDGGDGADTLSGAGGNDTLVGGAGDDVLTGGAGPDALYGGAFGAAGGTLGLADGADTASYAASAAAVTINLTNGTGSGGDAAGDTFFSIENLIGSAFNDSLTGYRPTNQILGVAHKFSGLAGNDYLEGGNGDDVFDGGDGNDTIYGVLGNDTATYASATKGVTVDLSIYNQPQDTVGAGFDRLADIDNLIGSGFADTLKGNSGDNRIEGGAGDDTFFGLVGGNDTFIGGSGIDTAEVYGLWRNITITELSPGTFQFVQYGQVSTTSEIEKFGFDRQGSFGRITVAAATILNDAPIGVDDTNAGLVEAGGGSSGVSSSSGAVLANDTDADDALGELRSVTGIRTGTEAAGGAAQNVATSGTTAVAGTYGTLTIAADGTWSYTLDNADADTQALTGGTTGTENFTYTVADFHGLTDTAQLTLTIAGSNDAPVAADDSAAGLVEATETDPAFPSATGTVLANDVDVDGTGSLSVTGIRTGTEAAGGSTQSVSYGTNISGTYGFLGINPDGTYSYLLDNADPDTQALTTGSAGTETFTYTLTDASGLTDTAQLTLTIAGSNDAPVAFGDANASLVEATSADAGVASATGAVLTNDTDIESPAGLSVTGVRTGVETAGGFFQSIGSGTTIAGTYGTLTIAADGTWSYALDNGDTDTQALAGGNRGVEFFTYIVTDAGGATDTAELTLTITGSNDAPVVTGETGYVSRGSTLTLSAAQLLANDGDVDGGALTITSVGGASNGTVSLDNGQVSFVATSSTTPAGGGFDYVVSDGTTTTTGHVTLNLVTTTVNADSRSIATLAGEFSFVDGLAGNDTLIGGAGTDTLLGNAGNDILKGGTGADVLKGGADNDIYYVDIAADQVIEASGGGADTVYASADYTLGAGQEIETLRANAGATGLTLTGNELANALFGGSGADHLVGAGGNDTLNGGAGTDTLEGGIGNDSYYVDSAADQVIEAAGAGSDTVYASASFTLAAGQEIETLRANAGATGLTLTGNEIANALFGYVGADRLVGGGGNDTLNGGGGADTMEGGTGNDIYYVDTLGDQVLEAVGAGTDTVYAATNITLAAGQEIEIVRANAGATGLTITGNEFSNTLFGGTGNDALNGGAGLDSLRGGVGDDAYYVDAAGDTVIEAAGAGTDTVYASANYTLATGQEIEFLRGNAGATGLTLTGNEIANTIIGNAGADRLVGGGGNDTLNGGAGADRLEGGIGNDVYLVDSAADTVIEATGAGTDTVYASASFTLGAGQEIETLRGNAGATGLTLTGNGLANAIFGNTGADVLSGGGGADVLTGGAGADSFVFKAVSESVVGAGRVTIADFAAGQDHIDLSAIQAVTGASTDQAFSYIGAGVAFTNVAGQLHTVTSGSNTIVEGDVDGNGTADFQIAVRGLLTLQAGDFVL